MNDENIDSEFKDFITKGKYPCVMAQTVFKMDHYRLKHYRSMADNPSQEKLILDIKSYIESYDGDAPEFETFIACFTHDTFAEETSFESSLWQLLKRLHHLDNAPWDSTVSSDPKNENFSFSLWDRAFYIVGMHPNSSRKARQSPYPAIAFNLHEQFEKLREMGVYQNVKRRIRQRDKRFQGSINPMLKDFGKESEAKQYSGRQVDAHWECPFKPN